MSAVFCERRAEGIDHCQRLLGEQCPRHFYDSVFIRNDDSPERCLVLNYTDKEMALPCVSQFLEESLLRCFLCSSVGY